MIDPNASDWSDLDLLTTAEATKRLVAEIASVEREIADVKQSQDTAESRLAPLHRRLDALRDRLR